MSSNTSASGPRAQAGYQVRFDQGVAGAHRIGNGVDVIVWVDVLTDVAPTGIPELPAGPGFLDGA